MDGRLYRCIRVTCHKTKSWAECSHAFDGRGHINRMTCRRHLFTWSGFQSTDVKHVDVVVDAVGEQVGAGGVQHQPRVTYPENTGQVLHSMKQTLFLNNNMFEYL